MPEKNENNEPNPIRKKEKKTKAADNQLLKQFYVTLNATFLTLMQADKDGTSGEQKEIKEKIVELLSEDESYKSWEHAYFIEQLMVPLYRKDNFEIELKRRLVETEKNLTPELHISYKKEIDRKKEDMPGQQALLGRIINDLQWKYTIRQAHRVYASKARKNANLVFIGAIVSFFIFDLISLFFGGPLSFFSPDRKPYYIATALTAGFMGASFSILTGLKNQIQSSDLDTLKIIHRIPFILSRAIIGTGAALIFFYFLQSGIVKGELFPNFHYDLSKETVSTKVEQIFSASLLNTVAESKQKEIEEKIEIFAKKIVDEQLTDPNRCDNLSAAISIFLDQTQTIIPAAEKKNYTKRLKEQLKKKIWPENYTNYALLIVWCFLAGFSEKLVPNLLSKTEKQFSTA